MSNKLSLLVQFGEAGLDKLNGGLRNLVSGSKSGAGALRALQQDSARLKREITATGREIATASGNVTNLVDRERELAAQLDKTNARLEQQKRLMAIDSRADRWRAKGDALQSRGRDNIVGGMAMAAPLLLVGRAAMQNEKAMALMGQKLDLNRQQTDQLGASLLRAATNAKQLPENIIAGADFLASKGLGRAEIEGMIPVIGKFSTAWDVDVNDTAKAVHANFLSLKVPLKDAAASLQVMAAAGKAGGFEVRDMAAEFPVLASKMATLKSVGLPAVADLSAALQVLEAKTGDGAVAANSLGNMLDFALGNEASKRFAKFGIDIKGALKRAVAEGRSPIEELVKLTKQVTGGDEMQIGTIFSDKEARMGVTALIQETERYVEIREAALKARGLTEQEFKRMSETSSANMNLLIGSLQGLSVTFGTHLLPALVTGAQWLTNTTNAVAQWAQANPAAAATLMTLAKWLVISKIAVGAFQFAFGGTIKTVASGWRVLARWKEMGKFAGLLRVLKAGWLGLGKTLVVVGRAMLLNPIGIMVTLVGVAAYLIWKHWDRIKGAFAGGMAMLTRVGGWIKANFVAILTNMGPLGQAALFVIRNWSTIKTAFLTGTRGVGNALGQGLTYIRGFMSAFIQVGRDIVNGLVAGIRAAPGKVWGALKNIITYPITQAKKLLETNSPSRVFMRIGHSIPEGLALGIDRGRNLPAGSMGRLGDGFALPRSPFAAQAGAGGGAGASPARSAASAAAFRDIIFNLQQQPGEDAAAFAKRVLAELRKLLEREARGSYADR